MSTVRASLVVLLACASCLAFGCAPAEDAPASAAPASGLAPLGAADFEKTQQLVEMRDGKRLNTEVYVPTRGDGPWPILFTRTPYGLNHEDSGLHTALNGGYRELAEDGYIFVFQDIRGRYESDGTFVMLRPPKSATGAEIDEGTDTNDTIDWLLENVEGNNGRVGILGISYGGWLTVMAMIEPHPAVKAVSPQASPADMYLGDDFLHNGALRLGPAFGYVALMESGKTNSPFDFDQHDTYEWYLDLGPLANADERYFNGRMPSWNAFMENPNYTEYWQRLSVTPYLESTPTPTLNVAGWWDAEDLYGPLAIYEKLEETDEANHNHLVAGPWRHGGWSRSDGSSLGDIPFDSKTAVTYREEIQRPFFEHYLHGAGDEPWAPDDAIVFQTGGNEWQRFADWPPATTTSPLYLDGKRSLGFSAPTDSAAADSYVSDPANPVPYMPRPIPGFWQGGQALWKVEDQRFVDRRPDVLSYETEPLEEDVVIAGPIVAELFATTTGDDADWVVKLIDVFPDEVPEQPELGGYQLMIADEVFRGRFRESFTDPSPIPSGEIVEYTIDLGDRFHRFRAGHRIMVQIQSTWFPLIDRNPQTYVVPVEATEEDYVAATHTIHRSAAAASRIVLPVLGN